MKNFATEEGSNNSEAGSHKKKKKG